MLYGRAESYRMTSRYPEAIQDYTRAIDFTPDYASAIAYRGEAHRMLGQYDAALRDLDRAVELSPEDTFAIGSRGDTYRNMGRYDEAIIDYDRAIEIGPAGWMLYGRAESYRMTSRYPEAIQDYTRAIELNPSDRASFARRGEIYRLRRDYQKAYEDFDRAIRGDAKDEAWVVNGRGTIYDTFGLYDDALEDYRRAASLDETAAYVLRNLAFVTMYLGDLEDAHEIFSRALTLEPDNERGLSGRGECRRRLGRHDEALADLTAVPRSTRTAFTMFRLGLLMSNRGQPEEADELFRQAAVMGQEKAASDSREDDDITQIVAFSAAARNWREADKWATSAVEAGVPAGHFREAMICLNLLSDAVPELSRGVAYLVEILVGQGSTLDRS
jgi:tetratricopeptide (TPR) repeat protein